MEAGKPAGGAFGLGGFCLGGWRLEKDVGGRNTEVEFAAAGVGISRVRVPNISYPYSLVPSAQFMIKNAAACK